MSAAADDLYGVRASDRGSTLGLTPRHKLLGVLPQALDLDKGRDLHLQDRLQIRVMVDIFQRGVQPSVPSLGNRRIVALSISEGDARRVDP